MKNTPEPRNRPRLFIGSSVEGLDVARAVQSALYFDAEPILWSQGVFGLSGGTLETLVSEADLFDFAIFVLTADDFLWKKEQHGNAPRDNVLFELGLFMGKLGRERTFFVHCQEESILLPTDLAGVTSAAYLSPTDARYLQAALSVATTPILSAIRRLGPRGTSVDSRTLPKELDDLRTQVFEMRVALSSYAAYAGSRVPSTGPSRKLKSRSDSDLRFMEGTWKGNPTGSTAWCTVANHKARFLYCYMGNGEPTGEYFNWQRQGNVLTSQFRWFEASEIGGYAWFEIVSDKKLQGGWWMSEDVQARQLKKLPHVPGMVPLDWNKISNVVPSQIRKFRGPALRVNSKIR